MSTNCYLCNKGHKGGSLASDNVMGLVDCAATDGLNRHFTNQFSGGSAGVGGLGSFKVHAASVGGAKGMAPFWGESKRTKSTTPANKKSSTGKRKTAKRGKGNMRGGFVAESACDPNPKNAFDAYSLNITTVPRTSPSVNNGFVDYNQVTGSVLKALSAEVNMNQNYYNQVVFPTNMSGMELMRGGASPSCSMCGP